MRRIFFGLCFVAALAAAYEAGRRELGLPRARGAALRAVDTSAARARLEQHLSALRTQREHLAEEQRLRALEERVLNRWGESSAAAPASARTLRVREQLDRIAALDREIAAAQRALELSENAAIDRAATATPELRAAKIALREVHLERELAPSTR